MVPGHFTELGNYKRHTDTHNNYNDNNSNDDDNNSSDLHYSDIIRASWHLRSLAIHMFAQQCMQSSREIHLWLADSFHKLSVIWKAFPCYGVFKWIKQNFTISNVLGLRLQKMTNRKRSQVGMMTTVGLTVTGIMLHVLLLLWVRCVKYHQISYPCWYKKNTE